MHSINGPRYVYPSVTVFDICNLDIPSMVLITCKKCGELDYYTSKAFCNLTDFVI